MTLATQRILVIGGGFSGMSAAIAGPAIIAASAMLPSNSFFI